jgi:GNAT superfamily N-acetyltransferase
MEYEIARYRPEFRRGVIDVAQHLVSPDPALNDAWFKWKHEDNPYVRDPVVYVALWNGDVVGMRAFQGARWWLDDSNAAAAWLCACDLVIDPAHRGAKLFRRIMAFALADLAVRDDGPILNWSASPVTYGASRRSGWQLVAPYRPWARRTVRARALRAAGEHLRGWPLIWRFADWPAALAMNPRFDALDAAWSKRTRAPAIHASDKPRPDEMEGLVRRTRTASVQHVRDAAYYRWRFRNPLATYRFVYWDDPQLEGFLVLQLSRLGDAADVAIVDWAVAKPAILEAMLALVAEVGGYDSLSIWSVGLSADVIATLERNGFSAFDDSRGDPAFQPGLLAIGPNGSAITTADTAAIFASPHRWDLRMAYSDFY